MTDADHPAAAAQFLDNLAAARRDGLDVYASALILKAAAWQQITIDVRHDREPAERYFRNGHAVEPFDFEATFAAADQVAELRLTLAPPTSPEAAP